MQRLTVAAGLLAAALAAVLVSCGSGSAGGGAASHHGAAPPAAAAPPGASPERIHAIAAIIARTSNPDDAFVAFSDTSDKDGVGRYVQMSCGQGSCHYEALCDKAPLGCDQIGPKLRALGLQPDTSQQGIYFTERSGSPADFAQLTETVYLTVYGASPGYRLSWRTNRQTTELPVQ
jgi:hypothetical protein